MEIVEKRFCPECKEEKDASKFKKKDKRYKTHLCGECRIIYERREHDEWKKNNREKVLLSAKKHYKNNKEKHNAYGKEYWIKKRKPLLNSPERIEETRRKRKEYNDKNRDRLLKKRRDAYWANPEKERARRKTIDKRYVKDLSDSYVTHLLDMETKSIEIPKEVLELKRLVVQLKREIKVMKR